MPRQQPRKTRPCVRMLAGVSGSFLFLAALGACAGPAASSTGPDAVEYFGATPTVVLPASVREEWRGKIVVADFWATWCRPCLASSPNVQWLHDRYAGDPGVLVVAVHADDGVEENPTEHARARGHTYPVIDKGQNIKMALDVYGLPTFIVLDREGRQVHRRVGALTLKERQAIVDVVEGLERPGVERRARP